MEGRLPYGRIAPGVLAAMRGLDAYVAQSGLDGGLIEMVKLRASQINGCAYCVNLHSKELEKSGSTEQRIRCLSVWREAPFYTDRERAALAWTEAVTLVSETHVPDEAYDQARQQFGDKELIDLTLAIAAINGWNRLAISFRIIPRPDRPAER